AVRLLQLKAHARTAPDRPAVEVVPSRYVSLFTMPWYVSLYGYLTDDERLITGLDDLDSFRADHASEAIDRMERLWDLRPPGDPEPEPDQPPDTPPADTGDEPAS
ncbi:hypothetical protein, partial [Jatrophihabitans endophyticus]|uniref:hypothetical protein n=1 Tax=Jatrophihabitans endophyticus TaxID=1206085 RepID=UPI0026EB002C